MKYIATESKLYFDKVTKCYVEFRLSLIKMLEPLIEQPGIYRLYDGNKNMIYIGKSYDLANRVLSSSKERKASYFSFAAINNKADVDLYETYYIAIEKPLLNKVSNNDDIPSFKFPALKFSKLYALYELGD